MLGMVKPTLLHEVAGAQSCLYCEEPLTGEMLGYQFCSTECSFFSTFGPEVECKGCKTLMHASDLDEHGHCSFCASDLDAQRGPS